MEHLLKTWKHMGFRERELKAFQEVDRKGFVMPQLADMAYEDSPLPLMRGKTISQPTTVMIMTAALELEKGDRVLEIGTGSGYQAAIIAKIIGDKGLVISTEVIPELVSFARENLDKAGVGNVIVIEKDGSRGVPEEAPFDKIIITAAAKDFPKPLIGELKTDGIIVAPIGDRGSQEMIKGIKSPDGRLDLQFLGSFVFTPMYGKYGFEI